MEKFKLFIKETKISTRILFVLWIIFSIFAKFPNETRLQIVLEFGAVFLIPAILIESFKNPVFKKDKAVLTEESGESLGRKLKNILFSFRWVYMLMIAMWVYLTFFSSFSKSEGYLSAAMISFIFFILPIIILEIVLYSKKHRKPVEHKAKNSNENADRYISLRRKIGLVLLPIAVLFVFIGVTLNSDPSTYKPNNIYPGITFGFISLILLLSSIGDPKTKTELAERKKAKSERDEQRIREIAYRGVYLTEEQIQKLENKVELPIVDTPIFLSHGEVAVYYSCATRQETKNRVIGRTGGYSGETVRIAKRFSIHTGRSSSQPVYGDVSIHYEGEMVLTNKRIIFLSNQKAFEVPYTTITAAMAYSDGISIQSRSHTYTLILPKAELAIIAFDAVRTGEIPIANTTIYVENRNEDFDDYMDLESGNIDAVSVSSVDGMEGHEFEYFSADLLRKNGFTNVSVTPGSGDQGVDILAEKGGVKYAIQCKNYASALSNTSVQEVNAGKQFYNCHVGVVLTNSTFTLGAKKLADVTGVLLWDRTELQKMIDTANMEQDF